MIRFTVRAILAALAILAIGAPAIVKAAEVVRVGIPALAPEYAIYYAGNDLGIYQKAGLEVSTTQFRGGPAAQEALAAGSIDVYSIVPTAASLAIQKGVKEEIVALFVPPTPSGWHIMVNAGSPIKSMADLNGKTVGVTQKGSLTDFWVLKAAKAANVEVKTVPLGGGVAAGLQGKQVDAAILWPMYSYKGLVDGSLRSIDDLGRTMQPTVREGIAASDDFINAKPEILKRWLAATSRTIAYMQSHEDWTVQYLKKYVDESDDKIIRLAFTDVIKNIPADGAMQPAWMKESLELGTAAGVVNPLPVEKIFTTKFTPIKASAE